jgi:hypothetical protein
MLGTYTKFYFSAKLIENLYHIHANPVKETLVPHPGDRPWSTWSYHSGGDTLMTERTDGAQL